MDSSGTVLDVGGIPICTTGNYLNASDVSFDGENHLVVWEDFSSAGSVYGEIYGTRVDTLGTVLDPGRIGISVGTSVLKYEPCVMFCGSSYFVPWCDTRNNGQDDIFGARVRVSGTVADTDGILVSTSANNETFVAVAYGEVNYLVVWQDERAGTNLDIYGTRLDMSGQVLDPTGIPISTGDFDQVEPAVAYGNGKYFVVWGDRRAGEGTRAVYGARVDTSGVIHDPSGIGISTQSLLDHVEFAVACNGKHFLVVWGDSRNGSNDVFGTRVDSLGTVLDAPPIAIADASGGQYSSSVVAGADGDWLVTWLDDTIDDGDIWGAIVDSLGAVEVSDISIYVGQYDQGTPASAFDGTNYLVVWGDGRNGSDWDIYGARVSGSGTVLDPSSIAISTATNTQTAPALAFDGTTYLTVWKDGRGGTDSYDLYGARLHVSGLVIDADGFPVSLGGSMEEYLALAHGPGRTVLIAYDFYSGDPYQASRIWGRFWPGPTPVTFLACRAEESGGAVTLSWQVACDVPALSFEVERANSAQGDYVALDVDVARSKGTWFSCVDRDVVPGATYWYKVSLVGADSRETFGPIEVRVERVPVAYVLYQSYPNPFNPTCFIRFDVPHSGRVTLRMFDASGRVVRTVADRWMDSGSYTEVWDGRDDKAVDMPSGVYFYELATPDFRSTRKAVMLR